MRIVGLDIETSEKPNHFPWKQGFYISTISLSYPDETTETWVIEHDEEDNTDALVVISSQISQKIQQYDVVAAHNLKFDLNSVRNIIDFGNTKFHCTMVAEYMLSYHCKDGLDLDTVAKKYNMPGKLDMVKTLWQAGVPTREIPLSMLTEYCEDDATKTRKIAQVQTQVMFKMGLTKSFDLQMEWLDMLSFMETNGIVWDTKKADSIIKKYDKYDRIIESKIKKLIEPYVDGHDVNLASGEDLSCVLYGGTLLRKEKVPVIKTKNIKVQMPYVFKYKDGRTKIKQRWVSHPDTRVIRMVYGIKQYSIRGLGISPPKGKKGELKKSTDDRKLYITDKDTLSQLRVQTRIQKAVVRLLLKKSKLAKVLSTFSNETKGTGLVSKIGIDGRLHTNYNQAVTATGRLSSSDPNSQNLPRGGTSPIKTCIIPEFDMIMNSDLSQIEWRVPAQLSQDPVMISEICKGVDQHVASCVNLMQLPFKSKKDAKSKLNRYYAKTFNFRMIYGGSEYGFHRDPNMPDFGLKKWGKVIKAFFAKYRGLAKWHKANIKHVIQGNGTLVLPTGRIYKFKLDDSGKYNERQIKNYPVQGFAGAEILPLAAVIIWKGMKKRGLKSKPILTVHDSVVFDVVKSEKDVLADLCIKVFRDLPKYIKLYWGFDWQVPIEGEVEVGPNYGRTTQIR